MQESKVNGGNEAAIAAAAGCSVAEATAELSEGLAELKEMSRALLSGQDDLRGGQDEMKAMLVQVLEQGGARGEDAFDKFLHTANLSTGAAIPWDDFVTCFEGEYLGGADLPDDLNKQFKDMIDKDGDGSIKGSEFMKFSGRYAKWKNDNGDLGMLEFLKKWLTGEAGPTDTVLLQVEVPFGFFPGMTLKVENEVQAQGCTPRSAARSAPSRG